MRAIRQGRNLPVVTTPASRLAPASRVAGPGHSHNLAPLDRQPTRLLGSIEITASAAVGARCPVFVGFRIERAVWADAGRDVESGGPVEP